jgi:preprotein translocase subunit SecF
MNDRALVTIVVVVFILCLAATDVVHNFNKRIEAVESLRVEKQHELEVTKQQAIEKDKSKNVRSGNVK